MKERFRVYFPVFLILYHLAFALAGFLYITEHNGDAVRYWFVGQDLNFTSWSDFLKPGTDVIKLVTFPLVQYLHLPFWSGFFIFSAIGAVGWYRLWLLLSEAASGSRIAKVIAVFLLVLPNAHFWTSLIGKEAPLFTALAVVTEQVYRKRYFSWPLLLSVLVVVVIRPHVAAVLLLSLLAAVLWDRVVPVRIKWQAAAFSVMAASMVYGILGVVARSRGSLWERILRLYHVHITKLRATDAHVPLDEYPLPCKLFTFYFRPLPFEKSGFLYRVWSLDNCFLLVISLATTYFFIRNFRKLQQDAALMFCTVFLLALALMYVYAYANWGLIARTKIMAVPMFCLVCTAVIQRTLPQKSEK